MKASFIVTLNMPVGVTKEEVRRHIRNAVRLWGGSYDTDDPFFPPNLGRVTVRQASTNTPVEPTKK